MFGLSVKDRPMRHKSALFWVFAFLLTIVTLQDVIDDENKSSNSLFANAVPVFDQNLVSQLGQQGINTQFACAIASTRNDLGVIIMSRLIATNMTTVQIYNRNTTTGNFSLVGDPINAIAFDPSGITTNSYLRCSVDISDDLRAFVLSYAPPTPGVAVQNPAQIRAYRVDFTDQALYTLVLSVTSAATNSSTGLSVSMQADGSSFVATSPSNVFETNAIILFNYNGTTYTSKQIITPPINESSLGSNWVRSAVMSDDGLTMLVGTGLAPRVYIFTRNNTSANFTFVDRLLVNQTGAVITQSTLAGNGKRIIASFDWSVVQSDSSTNRYNGFFYWDYDTKTSSWPADPKNFTFGVPVYNEISGVLNWNYAKYLSGPISTCSAGKNVIAIVFTNTSGINNINNVTFSSFVQSNDGTWTETAFPLPGSSSWLLPSAATLQQTTPNMASTSPFIGYTRMLSGTGNYAVVPVQQQNSSGTYAFWANSYSKVGGCGSNAPSDGLTTGAIIGVVLGPVLGVGLIAVFAGVFIA